MSLIMNGSLQHTDVPNNQAQGCFKKACPNDYKVLKNPKEINKQQLQ